jgi:hypothetical protein
VCECVDMRVYVVGKRRRKSAHVHMVLSVSQQHTHAYIYIYTHTRTHILTQSKENTARPFSIVDAFQCLLGVVVELENITHQHGPRVARAHG